MSGSIPGAPWQPAAPLAPAVAAVPPQIEFVGGANGAPSAAPAVPVDETDSAGDARPRVPSPPPSTDPALDQGPTGAGRSAATRLPAPDRSFAGISSDAVWVPDAAGDIGRDRYVEVANGGVEIFDRSGTSLSRFRMNTLFSPLGATHPCAAFDRGDPVVAYDERADRFVMSEFAFPEDAKGDPTGPAYSCLAVSTGAGAGAQWCVTSFEYSPTDFYDYPKLGIWGDSYLLSAVHYTGGEKADFALAAIERQPLLDCSRAPGAITKHINGLWSSPYWLALDADGTQAPTESAAFAGFVDDGVAKVPHDELQILQFTPDYANGSVRDERLVSVPTASFDSNLCQFDSSCLTERRTNAHQASARLDPLADRLMNRAAYRQTGNVGHLVLAHTVDVDGHDHAGVRWYELTERSGQWSLVQQGTYHPADTVNRWLPSVAMNDRGDLAVVYAAAGPGLAPAVRAAARHRDSPKGRLPIGETTMVASPDSRVADSATDGDSRWGDYGNLTIDPTDQCRFWYAAEYLPDSTTAWGTRILSFRMPECGAG